MSDYTFQGWAGYGPDSVQGHMKLVDFNPPAFDDDYVDVKVQYTGICATDTSQLAGHWGPYNGPIVCGHEIVGQVVRVGPKATGVKVGDRVGVGAQCDCCRECEWCVAGKDNFCPDFLYTFGVGKYSRGINKGQQSYGGFATHWRGPSRFVIPVPDGVDPAQATSFMCAGMTVFAPFKRFGVPHKAPKVGVLGIGGVGHMAIKIAKAMGAEVTAISRGEAKRTEALELGADHFIPTGSDLKADLAAHARSVDLVISTINPPSLDLEAYATLVKPEGTFCLVGVVVTPIQISATQLIFGSIAVSGSNIASPSDLKELLQLAADKKIEPWVQKYKWEDMNKAIVNSNKGKAKFRSVLVLEQNGGKL
ncbi:hypothetical protein CcaverHIS002_0312380 [Cutaneotrichosporon cavernicola]|uniref:Enoyl reductase (ER) domain-containing protein n=1 Tax=Cutaneotrichosporon cavernicola TaxID=279322 RepID=A0AA48QVA0_9TREE|nr:uncharacterized protein CcaverHIS019_0312250 [Cutaneotrichosporon cavernicola]BEI83370.1 hypothetical protein CcaverHIS002_0312380 [Cutaneotrichosporon cavernicola]BEI91155.1 hypothetical protein CcaverHIS019_0312250 [Cutaneotrichosporon cavernicola]BEI98932.1 hypothetical protein CcaverHIS631_0312310 [Cutaneotrichosporon cavernicola]BEJ06706.1 hypothetical protein CcaverHIS641_0312280 [Cutaneotrichosporon cavernicola]